MAQSKEYQQGYRDAIVQMRDFLSGYITAGNEGFYFGNPDEVWEHFRKLFDGLRVTQENNGDFGFEFRTEQDEENPYIEEIIPNGKEEGR